MTVIYSTNTMSTATATPKKPPKHQIFADCIEYTLDPYWRKQLEDFSNNKFPKKCTYNGGIITYKVNKTTSIRCILNIEEDDPIQLLNCIKEFMYKNAGLQSDREQAHQNEIVNNRGGLEEFDVWKKLKKKNVKEPIINAYILKLQDKYNLDDIELLKLNNILKLSFEINSIDSTNIEYDGENAKIDNIDNVEFNPDTRTFTISNHKPVKINYKKALKISPLEKWKKLQKSRNAMTVIVRESIDE